MHISPLFAGKVLVLGTNPELTKKLTDKLNQDGIVTESVIPFSNDDTILLSNKHLEVFKGLEQGAKACMELPDAFETFSQINHTMLDFLLGNKDIKTVQFPKGSQELSENDYEDIKDTLLHS
jgi:hypothetical protein